MKLIEQILAKNNVREALNRVMSNKGASGIDLSLIQIYLKEQEALSDGVFFYLANAMLATGMDLSLIHI